MRASGKLSPPYLCLFTFVGLPPDKLQPWRSFGQRIILRHECLVCRLRSRQICPGTLIMGFFSGHFVSAQPCMMRAHYRERTIACHNILMCGRSGAAAHMLLSPVVSYL